MAYLENPIFSTPKVKLAWHEYVEAIKIRIGWCIDTSGYASQWSSSDYLAQRQTEYLKASIMAAGSVAEQILALKHVWMKQAHVSVAMMRAYVATYPSFADASMVEEEEKMRKAENEFLQELHLIHTSARKLQKRWRKRTIRPKLRIRIPPDSDDEIGSGEMAPIY